MNNLFLIKINSNLLKYLILNLLIFNLNLLFNILKLEVSIRVTNLMDKGTARVNFIIKMVAFMMENGIITKCKVLEFCIISPITKLMKVNGSMTSFMVREDSITISLLTLIKLLITITLMILTIFGSITKVILIEFRSIRL